MVELERNRRRSWIRTAAEAQNALRLLFACLAGVYLLFAVLNALRLDPGRRWIVVAANLVLAAAFAGIYLLARRGRIPARWNEAVLVAAFLVVLANTLNTYWILGNPLYTSFMGLSLVGLAAFTGSDRWFATGMVTMTTLWTVVNVARGPDMSAILERCFFFSASVIAALVIYLVRRHGLIQLGRALEEQESLRRDLSQREMELRAREKVLLQFVRRAPAAVAMFDARLRYLAASDRWVRDYGLEGRELVGRSLADLHPGIKEEWREVLQRCLDGERLGREEDPFERPDGTLDWLRWDAQPWRDASGEVGGLLIFTEIVTEAKRARDALRRRARVDPLTGALNRAALDEDLARLWSRARGDGEDFAVLFVDLDDFKGVNDSFGHAVGDDVLVEVAGRLKDALRPGDLVARLGGDEFVLVAHRVPGARAASALAHRAETSLDRPIPTRKGEIAMRASIGVALSSEVGSFEELLAAADRAMYEMKRGRPDVVEGQATLRFETGEEVDEGSSGASAGPLRG